MRGAQGNSEEREECLVQWWQVRAQLVRGIKEKEDLKKCAVSQSKNRLLLFGEAAGLCAIVVDVYHSTRSEEKETT